MILPFWDVYPMHIIHHFFDFLSWSQWWKSSVWFAWFCMTIFHNFSWHFLGTPCTVLSGLPKPPSYLLKIQNILFLFRSLLLVEIIQFFQEEPTLIALEILIKCLYFQQLKAMHILSLLWFHFSLILYLGKVHKH